MLLLAGGDTTLAPDQASALDEHVSDCEGSQGPSERELELAERYLRIEQSRFA